MMWPPSLSVPLLETIYSRYQVGKQPEAKLSTKIMKAWRGRGAWCMKIHGSEFQTSGVPDIAGVYRGISIWCETKMPGNHTSKIQDYRIQQIRDAGGLVVVAYSVEEALVLLDTVDLNIEQGWPFIV